jgi:mannose-6-phosphate isomerase
LLQIVQEHPRAYLGAADCESFPVLIKLIDAAADLSVQVHPDDQLARQLSSDGGKTESWFVLSATPGAQVVTGITLQTPEAVAEATRAGCLGEFLVRQSVRVGDLVHIPAGTVHALLRGVRVIEVQQTSDLTYRLFDWNRVGNDGRPRDLHLHQALQAIHYPGCAYTSSSHLATISSPVGSRSAVQHLVQTPYYSIDRLTSTETFTIQTTSRPLVLIVTGGKGRMMQPTGNYQLQFGTTWLLPSGRGPTTLSPIDNLQLLLLAFGEEEE